MLSNVFENNNSNILENETKIHNFCKL